MADCCRSWIRTNQLLSVQPPFWSRFAIDFQRHHQSIRIVESRPCHASIDLLACHCNNRVQQCVSEGNHDL